MPLPIASGPPAFFSAGDTLSFTVEVSGFPSSLWYYDFALIRLGVNLSTTRGTISGTGALVTIAAATTATLAPGQAQQAIILTEIATGARQTRCAAPIAILPNPAASLAQTPTQAMLAAAKAKMLELLGGAQSVDFNGQTFTNWNLDSLQKIIDRLQNDVNAELRALGVSQAGGAHTIQFSFAPR